MFDKGSRCKFSLIHLGKFTKKNINKAVRLMVLVRSYTHEARKCPHPFCSRWRNVGGVGLGGSGIGQYSSHFSKTKSVRANLRDSALTLLSSSSWAKLTLLLTKSVIKRRWVSGDRSSKFLILISSLGTR